MAAAEAARVAASTPIEPTSPAGGGQELTELRTRLADALTAFEDARAGGPRPPVRRLHGRHRPLAGDPALHARTRRALGLQRDRRRARAVSSNLIHGRLLSHARKWDDGRGPLAVLACPSGELHTIGLLCFGLALRSRGWRITYVGADTPLTTLLELAGSLRPARVVLASVRSQTYLDAGDVVTEIARQVPVAIAGAGLARCACRLVLQRLGRRPTRRDARFGSCSGHCEPESRVRAGDGAATRSVGCGAIARRRDRNTGPRGCPAPLKCEGCPGGSAHASFCSPGCRVAAALGWWGGQFSD